MSARILTTDWPLQLKLTAAATELAPCFYMAWVSVYGTGSYVPFADLDPTIKQAWVTSAGIALQAMRDEQER